MVIAYRTRGRAFFLYGFAKNARDNIDDGELQTLRNMADEMLAYGDAMLEHLKVEGELQEIDNGKRT